MSAISGGRGGVLIFGAYGGIGSALARRRHGDGVPLALSGRDETRLSSLASELDPLSLPADASDFDAVDAVTNQRPSTRRTGRPCDSRSSHGTIASPSGGACGWWPERDPN
jgi:NAD(P)-dependent dehydrogenase (short-subunit alcohol dehydrogenase family)